MGPAGEGGGMQNEECRAQKGEADVKASFRSPASFCIPRSEFCIAAAPTPSLPREYTGEGVIAEHRLRYTSRKFGIGYAVGHSLFEFRHSIFP